MKYEKGNIKEEMLMKFVIFLDVDGVLNSRTTVQRSPEGYKGIDDARVEILANAIKKYGSADIVLSSDWKMMKPNDEDFCYLVSKLGKYGLKLAGKTIDCGYKRGAEIQNYIEEHPEIEEFVILDDNKFDFMDYPEIWERLLLTDGIEHARFASDTPAIEAMIFIDYIKEVS